MGRGSTVCERRNVTISQHSAVCTATYSVFKRVRSLYSLRILFRSSFSLTLDLSVSFVRSTLFVLNARTLLAVAMRKNNISHRLTTVHVVMYCVEEGFNPTLACAVKLIRICLPLYCLYIASCCCCCCCCCCCYCCCCCCCCCCLCYLSLNSVLPHGWCKTPI